MNTVQLQDNTSSNTSPELYPLSSDDSSMEEPIHTQNILDLRMLEEDWIWGNSLLMQMAQSPFWPKPRIAEEALRVLKVYVFLCGWSDNGVALIKPITDLLECPAYNKKGNLVWHPVHQLHWNYMETVWKRELARLEYRREGNDLMDLSGRWIRPKTPLSEEEQTESVSLKDIEDQIRQEEGPRYDEKLPSRSNDVV